MVFVQRVKEEALLEDALLLPDAVAALREVSAPGDHVCDCGCG